MPGGIPTAIAIKSLIDLRQELKSIYKAGKDEIQYLLDDGLQAYVISQKDKFELLNTFLFRHDRVSFYDTFYPISLKGIDVNGNSYIRETGSNLKNVFKESNCITIIGDAGSGKTMLMKHFFLHFLSKEQEIPIYIELRNLNNYAGSLVDYINTTIFYNRLSPNNTILERLLTSGKFMFILDGYDELHSSNKLKRKEELSLFIDKYRHNYFLLTSRPGVHIESLPRFHNFSVCSIPQDEIMSFVRQQLSVLSEQEHLLNEIEKIISDKKNRDYSEYLTNPLLLTMFLFTYKNHPEMPHTKSKFYYNIFDTLCVKHDNFSKHGDLHERKTKLKTEDFEEILRCFSYYSYFEGYFNFDKQYFASRLLKIKEAKKYDYDIDDLIFDLTVSLSIILIDGTDYKFPHRSLQEYFVAQFMAQRSSETKVEDYQKRYVDNYEHNYNLWLLSEELDFVCFRKFLIKEFDHLISLLDSNTSFGRTLNYMKMAKMEMIIDKNSHFFAVQRHDFDERFCLSCNYYIQNLEIFIFNDFIYTPELRDIIDNNPKLSEKCKYTIAPIQDFFVEDPFFSNEEMIENEDFICIVFTEEISSFLESYFENIGLFLFVDSLIELLKEYRERLINSIDKKISVENDLFDLK